ncbi:MAG: prepilin-type N-terminal cleavage/methylation domain-containing protein [Armatimonadetes bacterium]|nr:prepilin-type N-terminal cleavage/methylation domain-containing protein [Armatimonadota bacterium]
MRRRVGFTLIELLVVIAIIAILAAIIVPVFGRAKDSAYRHEDISSMNTLRSAVQLYYVDHGAYPPALLGYVSYYMTGPNAGNPIPANQINSYLYKSRVGSLSTFKPAYNRYNSLEITIAVYPNQDSRKPGTAPIGDFNGDGLIDGADDHEDARQAYGPLDGFVLPGGGVTGDPLVAAQFYRVSGYDVTDVPLLDGGIRIELRYTLFWTKFALQQNGDLVDDPRQMGYANPPDDTVITWNTYFRSWEGGTPKNGNRDIMLFVGGSAKSFSSRDVHDRSWRVTP